MNWKQRVRVWMARLALKGTGCLVVRRAEVVWVRELCDELQVYAQTSGGLNDPHRINAKRRVTRLTDALTQHADSLEVT